MVKNTHKGLSSISNNLMSGDIFIIVLSALAVKWECTCQRLHTYNCQIKSFSYWHHDSSQHQFIFSFHCTWCHQQEKHFSFSSTLFTCYEKHCTMTQICLHSLGFNCLILEFQVPQKRCWGLVSLPCFSKKLCDPVLVSLR